MGREKLSAAIKEKAVAEIESGRLSRGEAAKRLGGRSRLPN